MKVDQTKLGKILDVSQKSISRAIERKRLQKSITKLANGRYEIDLVTAILEWYQNADLSKDRGEHNRPLLDVKDLMEIEEARRIREHYLALLEKLEYEKKTRVVLDREPVEKKVFEIFRAARDKILGVPNKFPDEIRAQLLNELEKALEELSSNDVNFTNN